MRWLILFLPANQPLSASQLIAAERWASLGVGFGRWRNDI